MWSAATPTGSPPTPSPTLTATRTTTRSSRSQKVYNNGSVSTIERGPRVSCSRCSHDVEQLNLEDEGGVRRYLARHALVTSAGRKRIGYAYLLAISALRLDGDLAVLTDVHRKQCLVPALCVSVSSCAIGIFARADQQQWTFMTWPVPTLNWSEG